MKFILKDSERKPDPEPVKVNAKAAVLTGLVGWAVALLVFLLAPETIPAGKSWWLYTCVVGIGLGFFALFKIRR